MLTHIVRQFPTAKPTKFKLSVQMEDDDPLQLQAPRPPRSKVKVIPGPLMLTHIVRHIFRTARPTNFKLGTRMEDVDLHQRQASRPPRSKVKSHGQWSRDQSESSWPNAVPVSLEVGGGIPCRPNPAATLLVSMWKTTK